MSSDAMYCCKKCAEPLNLTSDALYPRDTYFEAGNKGTLSFVDVDMSKLKEQKEKRWKTWLPFFDSLDSWGFHRKRTQLRCMTCDALLGFIYYDMPTASGGFSGFGPSQLIPRGPRYRLKIKALQEIDPGQEFLGQRKKDQ